MPQLLERKRDRQAHIRLSIASRVFLWGNYPITKPSTICSNMSKNEQAECKVETDFLALLRHSRFSRRVSKNAPNDKIQSPRRFTDLV